MEFQLALQSISAATSVVIFKCSPVSVSKVLRNESMQVAVCLELKAALHTAIVWCVTCALSCLDNLRIFCWFSFQDFLESVHVKHALDRPALHFTCKIALLISGTTRMHALNSIHLLIVKKMKT